MAAMLRCVTLAPGEIQAFTFDWTLPLQADRIALSTWELEQPADGPLSADLASILTGNVKTQVTLSVDSAWTGGCLEAKLTNTITTDAALVHKRCIKVEVKPCGGCGC